MGRDAAVQRPRNSEIAIEFAADGYDFVLERPLVAPPGSRCVYNGGAIALLGHLIARGTGERLHDFARARLFGPLGILETEWVAGSNGEPAAASGLRMRPRDLARNRPAGAPAGRWGERQVVPAAWLEESFATRVSAEAGLENGYHWWLGRGQVDGRPWIAGFGNGGERLVIGPDLDLVVPILAGNYHQPDAWKVPVAISQILLPALREG